MDRRTLLTAGAGLLFSGMSQASGTQATAKVVSVDAFGATPNGGDATAGVRAAISQLPKFGGAKLYFPPGNYRFDIDSGTAMSFESIENLTVEGSGCTFLFHGNARPMMFHRCDNLILTGCEIDWNRPPFSQGNIIGIENNGLQIDLRIDWEFPINGSEVFWSLLTYSRGDRQLEAGGIDVGDAIVSSKVIAPQIIRLALNRIIGLQLGHTVVLRHRLEGGSHVVTMLNCNKPRLMDIQIHAGPALAIFGVRCHDVLIERLSVSPTPGTSRLMSTNADAVHLANVSGRVDIRDSTMTGMGDDCINVLSGYAVVVDTDGARKLHVSKPHSRGMGPGDLPAVDDTVKFASATSLAEIGQDVVASAQSGSPATLAFTVDLPPGLSPGDLMHDFATQATLNVTHCRFPGNRARGVLAHGGATIENCDFANQFEQAILLSPNLIWMEGGPANQVRIKGNTFRGAVRGQRRAQATIGIDAILSGSRQSDVIVNHDILITDNLISDSGGGAIRANAVQGLSVDGNRIERPRGPAIVLQTVKEVRLSANTCNPPAAVVVAPQSTAQVRLDHNTGLFLS